MVSLSHKYLHDFTFHHLSERTDCKLRDTFEMVNDGYDNHTPDVVREEANGRVVAIEFTTTRKNKQRSVMESYKKKMGKYCPPCETRSKEKPISLFCIAVSESMVVTNLNLEQADVNELCFRFNAAVDVYSFLQRTEVIPKLDDGETTSIANEVDATFKDILFDWKVTEEKFPPFSKELYDIWSSDDYDLEYIQKMMVHCTQKACDKLVSDHLIRENKTRKDKLDISLTKTLDSVREYREGFSKHGKMRSPNYHKATIPFPAVVPKVSVTPSISLRDLVKDKEDFPECKNATGKLWREVFKAVATGRVKRVEEDQQTEEAFLMGEITKDEEHTASALRTSFHRVNVRLDNDAKVELATLGVEGKHLSNEPLVKEVRALKKKGFPLNTDVSDINEFLSETRDGLLEHGMAKLPEHMKNIVKANIKAMESHGFKERDLPLMEQVESFWESPLMAWCQMITAIGIELAAASKQHCKGGEFIIKKLRHYDIFMVVKPTRSDSHMFVSLAWYKDDLDSSPLSGSRVFKGVHYKDGWCWTEFHSFKPSKISTLVRTSSTMNNLYWFWREQYDIKPWDEYPSTSAMASVSKMMKLSLMVMLEDKAATEELCTNLRYTLLEGFVSEPCLPLPGKMIEKLPDVARTKLQVWLINKSLSCMTRVAHQPFEPVAKDGRMTWTGLYNPFTEEPVTDPYRLVNLMYLGYLKNKDESPEKNGCPALVRKIVKMEEAHPGRYEYLGRSDPPLNDIRTHEYSVSFQKYVCAISNIMLKTMWGESIHHTIHMDILNAFSSLTLDSVSTLKASSAFDETWYDTDGSVPYHRKKVVENFRKFISANNTHVHHVLRECLETIETRGCMHIDIFKKNQHGGLREIYVLGPEERVVQLALETIARQVCKRFKSETLTNPDQKTRIPESHGRRAKAAQRSHDITVNIETVGTSDDLKTFNQTQHTTKLALTLIKFTDRSLHPFIIRACSLFMRKRIKMDDDLLQIIVKNSDLKTDDPTLESLYNAYRGNTSPCPRWAEEGKSYIKTETGMLQGILHLLSSLHHTTLQVFYRFYAYHELSKIHDGKAGKVLVDIMQSSDDSAVLISYPWPDDDKGKRSRVMAAILLLLKKELGIFVGLYPSVKCTTNTLFFVEFNSEFFFHNDHIRPTIKWVIACDQVSEQEALVARQEEMASSLTGILEGGGSISLCHLCQMGQSILHYHLLGASVSFLFGRYMNEAKKFKDPSLGFFLLDHPFGAGIAGFKYNLWNQVKHGSLGAIYKLFLTQIKESTPPEVKEKAYRSLETTTCGALASSVTVRWGNRKKWQALLDRLDVPSDWEAKQDANPECCYRRPRTGQEVLLKVAEKLHSPGVSSALTRGDHLTKIISSSVYILSRNVVGGGVSWMTPETEVYVKEPLLRLLMKQNDIDPTRVMQLDDEEVRTLFPMDSEYRHVKNVFCSYGSVDGRTQIGRRKTVQTRVIVFQREEMMRARPEDVITDVWWAMGRSGLTAISLKDHFEQLQRVIPWLDPDPEETLKKSPFLHHHQIRNFFSRMDYHGRELKLVGAPLRQKVETNIATAIARNFYPSWELTLQTDVRARDRARRSDAVKHFCYLLTSGPYSADRQKQIFCDVMRQMEDLEIVAGAGKTRSNTLALMQRYVKLDDTQSTILNNEIRRANCGIVGGFSQPQQAKMVDGRVVYHGKGVWIGTVHGHRVEIRVDSFGRRTEVMEVRVDSAEFARMHLVPFMKQWGKDMNVCNTHRVATSDASFCMFNFEIYSYGTGCPVYVHESLGTLPDFQMGKMELLVNGHCISVVCEAGASRRVRILSFHGRPSDVSKPNADQLEDEIGQMMWAQREPSHSWFFLKTMHENTLSAHLSHIDNGKILSGTNTQIYLDILRDATSYYLRSHGYTIHDMPRPTISIGEAEAHIRQMEEASAKVMISDVLVSVGLLSAPVEPEAQEEAAAETPPEETTISDTTLIVSALEETWADIMENIDRRARGAQAQAAEAAKPPPSLRPSIFLDIPNLVVRDMFDVDAFGETDFEIMPRSVYNHPTLVSRYIETKITHSITPSEMALLLTSNNILASKVGPARLLFRLLQRDPETINELSVPVSYTEDLDVASEKVDESMFG
ncbi:polymerase [Uukuvirus hoplandense]|uniref:RNA-directed RNA polymerase L n=1 Tax=Pacific coast tick phlebovirus TaxID=1977075 RepID=A0A2R2WTE4_9VIRU|nr:polymerase [Pacific coast tick phlebovirus]ARF07706.1 polymerase [Pacific coast tick phlebovirus]